MVTPKMYDSVSFRLNDIFLSSGPDEVLQGRFSVRPSVRPCYNDLFSGTALTLTVASATCAVDGEAVDIADKLSVDVDEK